MLRAFRRTFQGPGGSHTESAQDLSPDERRPAIFLAFVLVIVGLFPNLLLGLIESPESSTSGPSEVQKPAEELLAPESALQPRQAMLAN